MSKNILAQRWQASTSMKITTEKIMQIFQNGGELLPIFSPFELIGDKLDFRGINVNDREIKNCVFNDIDFSFSSFKSTWIKNTKFHNCRFNKVDFSGFSDHGNLFDSCNFFDCKCNNAGIGYDGSTFNNCIFERCNYSKTVFIRPEYTKSFFKDCKINRLDFNASSFENCFFEGKLNDVWFRGGFPLQSDYEYYGIPKLNEMKNVSFEKAELRDITFSNNCNLSTVRVNNNSKYYIFNIWEKRLKFLLSGVCEWSIQERKEVDIFVNTHLVHAKTQEWNIINIDDLERDYGINIALKIIYNLNCL